MSAFAKFIVMVVDRRYYRYYGPFDTQAKAEAYAAPLRINGVHAVVQPLWRPVP